MKKLIIPAFAFLSLMVSCSKSDSNGVSAQQQGNYKSLPEVAIATYKGDLSYTGNVNVAEAATATATVKKTGDSYAITFSNAQLPADKRTITGIKFIEDGPGHFVSAVISGSGSTWGNSTISGIAWADNELDISFVSTNPNFTFSFSGIKQ